MPTTRVHYTVEELVALLGLEEGYVIEDADCDEVTFVREESVYFDDDEDEEDED